MRALTFAAIILTALALVPGGAHVLALPNKIALPAEAYFITQSVYAGWAWLGVVLIAAIAANLILAFRQSRAGEPFVAALLAGLCLLATLAIFFIWTFPANQATSNWTVVPPDWETLRTQWEYSHAVNAGITFLALCLIVLSALSRQRR